MKIQQISFAQKNLANSHARSRVNFRGGESLKAYNAVEGQACSFVEKTKEVITREVAQLAEKGDFQGVIDGKKRLINIIRGDGRPKAEQERDIYLLKQGIKEYVDKL